MIAKYKQDATASRMAAAKRRRVFEGICLFPALRVCLFSHSVWCSEVVIVRNSRAAQLQRASERESDRAVEGTCTILVTSHVCSLTLANVCSLRWS